MRLVQEQDNNLKITVNKNNINIEMANSLGFSNVKIDHETGEIKGDYSNSYGLHCGLDLPDYTSDLNLTCVAWEHLNKEEDIHFHLYLKEIVLRDGRIHGPSVSVNNATALQRCEAFLKAKNGWYEPVPVPDARPKESKE